MPRVPLCPIRAYAPLGVGASRLHQYRVHDGAEQVPHGEKCPRHDGSFHEVCPCGGDEGPELPKLSQRCSTSTS